MTVVSDYTALLSGGSWNDEVVGQSSFVTYSFPDSAPSYLSIEYSPTALATFQPLRLHRRRRTCAKRCTSTSW